MVGSSKRSILYLGKQAESYKVMIYAPPCLEMTVAEGVVDRKLATSPRISAGAHKKGTLERQPTNMHSITMEQHIQTGNKHGKIDMMHVILIAWHECNCKQL